MRDARTPKILQILIVGIEKEEFLALHGLLERTAKGPLGVDSAASLRDAGSKLEKCDYDLIIFEGKSNHEAILRLLEEGVIRAMTLVCLGDAPRAGAPGESSFSDAARNGFRDDSSPLLEIRKCLEVYRKERHYQGAGDMLRKLWSAVEQSADMVIITDRAGVVEYVNPAFEALTGYLHAEAVGQNLRMLKSDQQAPEVYREMWRAILAGSVFHCVLANRKKNGEVFFVEKSITPLRDIRGEITHFISNDRDITNRRLLEAQLSQAHKMDAVGRLAGGIAHDFNNLLLVISAYAELMQDALGTGHPLRRNVKEIMMAARRAADLTRQLLAFSRKQIQSLQLLDLNFVIRDIFRLLPRLIGEDIQLAFVPGENLGKVKADPGQIEQVLMNLAANGRDAMPRGGRLSLETSAVILDETYVQRHSIVPPGEYILLAVSDTGQGIAPEHMPHIFEPFYTTKEEGKGTGLGLSTVYGIVKQNGGFVWIYSEVGLGTTVKVYLPMLQCSTGEPPPLMITGPVQGGYETVLLVEDEGAVRQAAREFLTLNGYTVLEAWNGEDALRVSREFKGQIDLMISDVVMPEMGGAKLAEQLAQLRPEMKVLFVSGYAESTVQRHGAIDVTERFLQKPFSLKALGAKIREVLESGKALATAASAS